MARKNSFTGKSLYSARVKAQKFPCSPRIDEDLKIRRRDYVAWQQNTPLRPGEAGPPLARVAHRQWTQSKVEFVLHTMLFRAAPYQLWYERTDSVAASAHCFKITF